ncbi:MAG: ferritin-like domain-containing protein [Acidobacteriota bacterium]|nr:ferritin-like domain-containing protein [Acidobacteriota bacterium]
MTKKNILYEDSSDRGTESPAEDDVQANWQRLVRRRSFLQGAGMTGAALLPAGKLFAQEDTRLSKSDAALLRFAAAIEFVEADLWQQYNELGGQVDHNDNPNPGNPDYIAALQNLDGDMPQYISDNTDDEISHRDFLNAYLKSKGAQPVDFKQFETLPPTKAAGALGNGRLTNLQTLTVDTSWYFRYRSTGNPDLGAKFPQLLDIVKQPAIPLHDNNAPSTIQAIANIAAIHFAFIEQGGASLYPVLALKASKLEVLRILLSIGGVEIDHFSLWHDKMGNAVAPPVAPLSDPVTGLTFPNFNAAASQQNARLSAVDQKAGGQIFQTNLIQPEPCEFLSAALPACSIIRPTQSANGGPIATVQSFIAGRLFAGQSPHFLEQLMDLASEAEAAQRQLQD